MPPKKYSLLVRADHAKKRIDQVLAEWLPQAARAPLSKAQVRKLIVAGAVYLNGRRVRIASKELIPGAKIDVQLDLKRLMETPRGTDSDRIFSMTASSVLYEDEWIIAVDKPAGLPTQPTLDEARDNLYAAVKKYLSKRDAKPDSYLGLHHRLDRDTSGVVLFTKMTDANAGVSRLFTEHLAQKTYWALVRPLAGARDLSAQDEWVISNYLGKVPGPTGSGKRAHFGAVRSGGDVAETGLRCLERGKDWAWIEAKPKTGRTHQIRVHLSEAGFPLLGDPQYSPEAVRRAAPRLMLHAAELVFPHPITQVKTSIQSPTPEDFSECLKKLRS